MGFSRPKYGSGLPLSSPVDHILSELSTMTWPSCMQVKKQTVRTGHGKTDWLQTGKEVHQGCILSPCLFNLYADYVMWNAGLDEAKAGIKIARRNINNLRYADDTTLIAESEEKLKSLLMKVKEDDEKIGLKLNIQKKKTSTFKKLRSWSHHSTANKWRNNRNHDRLSFHGLQNPWRWWLQPWN